MLVNATYGKRDVRICHIRREKRRHYLTEVSVDVDLKLTDDRSYTTGDNSVIVATDTMKEIAHRIAGDRGIPSPEEFGGLLAQFLVQHYPQIKSAEVLCKQVPWTRFREKGKDHPHVFIGAPASPMTRAFCARRKRPVLYSGFKGLKILRTTGSSFTGFVRDEYTVLPEASDRMMATSITASWACEGDRVDWAAVRERAISVVASAFAGHGDSKSVQQTMRVIADAVVEQCPEIEEIFLEMPNIHFIPKGKGFLPTNEPYGNIQGTFRRDKLSDKRKKTRVTL